MTYSSTQYESNSRMFVKFIEIHCSSKFTWIPLFYLDRAVKQNLRVKSLTCERCDRNSRDTLVTGTDICREAIVRQRRRGSLRGRMAEGAEAPVPITQARRNSTA